MQVGSSTSTQSTGAAADAAAKNTATVDYNSFLTLLVAEMKNQDPTAPSDPTQFMSQLASFSAVEQGVQTNTKLDQLLTTNSLTQAESLIGKTVSNNDATVSGVVQSVQLATDGSTTATLTSGTTLPLTTGVSVSGS